MPTSRIDLLTDTVVNLTVSQSLLIGTTYQLQHRGTDGPAYVAELVAADPSAHDVASNGYVMNIGDTFRLIPRNGSNLYVMAPGGGRLTIGDVP